MECFSKTSFEFAEKGIYPIFVSATYALMLEIKTFYKCLNPRYRGVCSYTNKKLLLVIVLSNRKRRGGFGVNNSKKKRISSCPFA